MVLSIYIQLDILLSQVLMKSLSVGTIAHSWRNRLLMLLNVCILKCACLKVDHNTLEYLRCCFAPAVLDQTETGQTQHRITQKDTEFSDSIESLLLNPINAHKQSLLNGVCLHLVGTCQI